MSKLKLTKYRSSYVGFIFQDYNLLDTMSLEDNIALPLSLNGVSSKRCKEETENLAKMFGLQEHLKKYPYQLSGGQKQRVAIVRSLVKDTKIIMADEPTGALDSATGIQVIETLKKLSKDRLVIIVSHDMDEIAENCTRAAIFLRWRSCRSQVRLFIY